MPESAKRLDDEFRKAFPDAHDEYSRIFWMPPGLSAARNQGIAVILGTGSNGSENDGGKIVRNVRSGGFILGDEGGGASLGRQFMSDFLKGLVPQKLADEFASEYEVDYLSLVQNVYKGPAPARYLSSFAPFISSHYDGLPM